MRGDAAIDEEARVNILRFRPMIVRTVNILHPRSRIGIFVAFLNVAGSAKVRGSGLILKHYKYALMLSPSTEFT